MLGNIHGCFRAALEDQVPILAFTNRFMSEPVDFSKAMQEKAVVGPGGLELYGVRRTVLLPAVAVAVVGAAQLLEGGDEGLLGGEDEVLAVQVVLDERGQLLDHGELGGGHPRSDLIGFDCSRKRRASSISICREPEWPLGKP